MSHTDITLGLYMPPWPLPAYLWALVGCSASLSVKLLLCLSLCRCALVATGQAQLSPAPTQCGPSRLTLTSREFGILQKTQNIVEKRTT